MPTDPDRGSIASFVNVAKSAPASGHASDTSWTAQPAQPQADAAKMRRIVAASAAGTAFEWYDFLVYGTLSMVIGKVFFPAQNAALQVLLVWAGFAAGFGFRPLGAILFGYLGDRFGRKYTFLATVTLMGSATASIGLVPSEASIGIAAPIVVILLRVLQGLAVGGEHGGAMTYVAEHAPAGRKGRFTSFIQAGGPCGFLLSLVVVLACKAFMSEAVWIRVGWRLPFLLSFGLLAISLWMRLKLSESPIFQEMKAKGELSANPFVRSFTYPGNKKRLFVALFGVSAGMNVISYTASFQTLSFLESTMRMDETVAQVILVFTAIVAMSSTLFFGRLSDRIGRKASIVGSYILVLLLLFPLYWTVGYHANPKLAQAAHITPIVVVGPDCRFNPFLTEQQSRCGKLLADLSGSGAAFRHGRGARLSATVGGRPLPLETYRWQDKGTRNQQLQSWLTQAGYDLAPVRPSLKDALAIFAAIAVMAMLVGACFGPVPALLTGMFPAPIRYSSLSIPYHIGAGYFGGFLPLIAAYIVTRTGNPYTGLWYTWIVVALALLVALWGIESGPARSR